MITTGRGVRGILVIVILFAGGIQMLRAGLYGWTLFILFPVILGGVGAWMLRPATERGAVASGALSTALASGSLLILGMEGVICIAMALPLTIPLGALGGWLVYQMEPVRIGTRRLTAFLLLPSASLAWDAGATPPVFEVRTAIEVAAPPEEVWKHVVTFSELPEPQEWFFRSGLAYPIRARIEGSGAGAVRYCEFSTGPFVEPIEVWNEPHLLRFGVTENPAPMHEWSPYARVVPKHLHRYLISKRGEFRLMPLANGRTLLEGTTWYQHGLWPAQYWRWWSDAIIHRIHTRVLTHIRALSEKEHAARKHNLAVSTAPHQTFCASPKLDRRGACVSL